VTQKEHLAGHGSRKAAMSSSLSTTARECQLALEKELYQSRIVLTPDREDAPE